MHALTATLVAIALTAGAPVSLWSQWQIGGEIGVARFGGTSRDTDGTKVAPYRPTTLARGRAGWLRVGGVLTGSVFDPDDVPTGVERLATRRLAVAIGLRYGL